MSDEAKRQLGIRLRRLHEHAGEMLEELEGVEGGKIPDEADFDVLVTQATNVRATSMRASGRLGPTGQEAFGECRGCGAPWGFPHLSTCDVAAQA